MGWGPAPCIDALGHEVRPMAAKYGARSASSRRITTMMHRRSLRPYMAHRQSSYRSQASTACACFFHPGHRMLHAGVVVAPNRLHLQCHSRRCGGAPPRPHTYLLNMYCRKLL